MITKNKDGDSEEQEIDIELCIICMDDNNQVLKQHPCLICDKKAWNCCEECISQLENCPICRAYLNINNNTQENNINPIILPWYKKCYNGCNMYLNSHPYIDTFLQYFCAIILTGVIFFYILFLGKVVVYIFCTNNCDKEKNGENTKGCECYDITQKDNYWTDLMHNFGGNLGVGILSHIIITILHKLKCCSSNRRNN
tara:strand:+ start:869 stop:1462 length:594 start_codon:yes stop_codon:yes gene_type:complete